MLCWLLAMLMRFAKDAKAEAAVNVMAGERRLSNLESPVSLPASLRHLPTSIKTAPF